MAKNTRVVSAPLLRIPSCLPQPSDIRAHPPIVYTNVVLCIICEYRVSRPTLSVSFTYRSRRFAGLMNGQQCYCVSKFGKNGPSKGCDIICVNDPSNYCGSRDAMSVYSTGQRGTLVVVDSQLLRALDEKGT